MSDDDRDPETVEKLRRDLDASIAELNEEVELKQKMMRCLNKFKKHLLARVVDRERAEALKPVHQWKWNTEMAREFAQPGYKDEPFICMNMDKFMVRFECRHTKTFQTLVAATKHRDKKSKEFGLEEKVATIRIQKRLTQGKGAERERFESALDVLKSKFPDVYATVTISEHDLPLTTESSISWNAMNFRWVVQTTVGGKRTLNGSFYLWQFADAIALRNEKRGYTNVKERNDAIRAADPAKYKDVPYAATNADAKKGVKHWSENSQDDYKPWLVLKGSENFEAACHESGCHSKATHNGRDKINCVKHGGGRRCEVHYVDMANPPFVHSHHQTISVNATLRIDGKDVPQPDVVGKFACLRCLRRYDPNHTCIRTFVRKEVMIVNAIVELLYEKGYGFLVGPKSGSLHDCPLGPSLRRPDVFIDSTPNYKEAVEIAEGQHKDRTTSCEHAKLAGTLMDLGAPGFTKAEGVAMDLTEHAIKALPPHEQPAINAARKRAVERVSRDYRTAMRTASGSGDSMIAPKFHVEDINPDSYMRNGKRVPSLFQKPKGVNDNHGKAWEEDEPLQPSPEFVPAIEKIVNGIIERHELAKNDPAWLEGKKELEVVYSRYDTTESTGKKRARE